MQFNSYLFDAFFAVVLAGYHLPILRWRGQKWWLLVASYAFYAAWDPVFVVLLWLSTVVTTTHKRALLITSVIVNIRVLAYFKYGLSGPDQAGEQLPRPDDMHLDQRDQAAFTRALVAEMRARGRLRIAMTRRRLRRTIDRDTTRPLNPSDRSSALDDEDVRGLDTFDAGQKLGANTVEIESLVPPLVDVGRREPPMHQREIVDPRRTKRDEIRAASVPGHRA